MEKFLTWVSASAYEKGHTAGTSMFFESHVDSVVAVLITIRPMWST